MTSRLYRPISDMPDASQAAGRRAGQPSAASSRSCGDGDGPGDYYDAFETRIYPQAAPSRPQHCLNEFIQVNEDDENSADPMLSATIRNLYEDLAPTEAQRSWNREYIDRAYPHNHNPINYRQQCQGDRDERLYRSERVCRNDEPDYRNEPPAYRNAEPNYQSELTYHNAEPVYGDELICQQGRVRLPSVHSTSGYGMYPESSPIGPAAAENLGRHSQTVECPWCHALVTTRIKRRIGFKAGGAAVLVAAIAWPLFWVPLVVPGLHRKTHYCPQCRRKIGRGRRSYR